MLALARRHRPIMRFAEGTASRWKTRYSMRLTERRRLARLAGQSAPTSSAPSRTAIAAAELASELRRGAAYVRVPVVLSVAADALTIA
jgi:hypothetical protein